MNTAEQQSNVFTLPTNTPTESAGADRAFLIAEYKKLTDPYEKARAEERIWESVTPDERKVFGQKRLMVKHLLGVSTNDADARSRLFALGEDAKPLWDRLRAGTVTSSAVRRLIGDAKWLAQERKMPLVGAVHAALAEYDAAPMHQSGGKLHMKRGKLRGNHRAARPNPRLKHTPLAEAGRFWESIRDQIAAFVKGKATEVDEIVLDRLMAEFMTDLKTLTASISSKIGRLANAESGAELVRRTVVIAACRVLLMDPPAKNRPVDLVRANRVKKQLARAYHPDTGGVGTEQKYQEVLEAFATLENYNEQLTRGRV